MGGRKVGPTDDWLPDSRTDRRTEWLSKMTQPVYRRTSYTWRSQNTKGRTCFFAFRILTALACLHLDVLSVLLKQHPMPRRKIQRLVLTAVVSTYLTESARFDGIAYQLTGKHVRRGRASRIKRNCDLRIIQKGPFSIKYRKSSINHISPMIPLFQAGILWTLLHTRLF